MGNFYMEATQINYRRDDKPKTVDQKLKELSETSAIDTDIAPVFKSTNTYQPGDMVYYSNKLYVFNVEHTGTWAAADVTATDVTTEISSLKSGLTNVQDDVKLNTQDLTTPSRTKNLLPITIDKLKKSNTTGTWSGNVYTIGYNTYTVSVDNNGVVTSIEGTSINVDSSAIKLDFDLKAGNYILSSGFVELFGANDTFLQKDGVTIARGNDASPGQNFTLSEDSELVWHFRVTNITKTCYPMIRPATITDPTFAPYIPSVESRIEAVESGMTGFKQKVSPNNADNSYSGDLDDLRETGNYLANSNSTNRPDNTKWFNVHVFKTYKDITNELVTQIACSVSSANVGDTYIRVRYLNGGWSSWKQITFNT